MSALLDGLSTPLKGLNSKTGDPSNTGDPFSEHLSHSFHLDAVTVTAAIWASREDLFSTSWNVVFDLSFVAADGGGMTLAKLVQDVAGAFGYSFDPEKDLPKALGDGVMQVAIDDVRLTFSNVPASGLVVADSVPQPDPGKSVHLDSVQVKLDLNKITMSLPSQVPDWLKVDLKQATLLFTLDCSTGTPIVSCILADSIPLKLSEFNGSLEVALEVPLLNDSGFAGNVALVAGKDNTTGPKINDLLKWISGELTLPDEIGDLELDYAGIAIAIPGPQIRFSLGLGKPWTPKGHPFQLDAVALEIDHSPGVTEVGLGARLDLTLPDSTSEAPHVLGLSISGTYASDGSGWQIQAGLDPQAGGTVSVYDLVDACLTAVGHESSSQSLPTMLKEILLKHAGFSLDNTGQFELCISFASPPAVLHDDDLVDSAQPAAPPKPFGIGKPFRADLIVVLDAADPQKPAEGRTMHLSGSMVLNGELGDPSMAFALGLEKLNEVERILAVFEAPPSLESGGGSGESSGGGFDVGNFLGGFMGDAQPSISDDVKQLKFELSEAAIGISHHTKPTSGTTLDFALIGAGVGLNLSEIHVPGLPIALSNMPPLAMNLHLAYVAQTVEADALAAYGAMLPPDMPTLVLPATAGLTIQAHLRAGTWQTDLQYDSANGLQSNSLPGNGGQGGLAQGGNGNPVPATSAPYSWVDVQRSIGPVHVSKVGIKSATGKAHAAMVGELTLGPITVSLIDLQYAAPFNKLSNADVSLGGLGLAYKGTDFSIGGSLLRTVNGAVTSYDGEVQVQTPSFSIAALGSFARTDDGPSLFIYGALDEPLGGPAFAFITGVALGFGLHRRLQMPALADVGSFPLVALVMQGGTAPPLDAMLVQLSQQIPIAPGENFFCAGIRFSSFELVDTFMLLAVQMGRTLEIDLLGQSVMAVPSLAPPGMPLLVHAVLDLEATILPEEGTFNARAQLTPDSYVYSPECHLTGAFASSAWTKGDHAGDFVFTLGGYHPAFKVPSHYPQNVDRLALTWQINSNLFAKGELYFALTGQAAMAGGALQAHFSAGSVYANFNCSADFLVFYKPYHYDAAISVEMDAGVTIHCFGTHHLSFNAGADLHLWGPPMTGEAHVHLKVCCFHVSLDVTFGAGAGLARRLDWSEFSKSFLHSANGASDPSVLSLHMVDGQIPGGTESAPSDGKENKRWLCNSGDFTLEIASIIPVGEVELISGSPVNIPADRNFSLLPKQENLTAGIHPMGLTFQPALDNPDPINHPNCVGLPKLVINLTRDGEPFDLTHIVGDALEATELSGNLPAALWAQPQLVGIDGLAPLPVNSPTLISGLRKGARLRFHLKNDDSKKEMVICSLDKLGMATDIGATRPWNTPVPSGKGNQAAPIGHREAMIAVMGKNRPRFVSVGDWGRTDTPMS